MEKLILIIYVFDNFQIVVFMIKNNISYLEEDPDSLMTGGSEQKVSTYIASIHRPNTKHLTRVGGGGYSPRSLFCDVIPSTGPQTGHN